MSIRLISKLITMIYRNIVCLERFTKEFPNLPIRTLRRYAFDVDLHGALYRGEVVIVAPMMLACVEEHALREIQSKVKSQRRPAYHGYRISYLSNIPQRVIFPIGSEQCRSN